MTSGIENQRKFGKKNKSLFRPYRARALECSRGDAALAQGSPTSFVIVLF